MESKLNLLEKELKVVEKYSTKIRDLYIVYHEKRTKLSQKMDEELKELKRKEIEKAKQKERKRPQWESTLT